MTDQYSAVARRFGAGAALFATFVLAASCGGGDRTPASPATPSTPTTPTTPSNTWSTAGQIVVTGTAQGVGGAVVTPGWALAPVTADANGNYEIGAVTTPPSTPYPLTLSAPGMISHDVWISWALGARTGVTLDLIRDAAPFSLEFYRQFTRDTFDNDEGAPWPLLRWTSAPSFYVRTVDQNGRAVEPEVIAVTLDALRRAVPGYTGGRYAALAIETGADSRPAATGWINVVFRRETGPGTPCGTSFVGSNPGTITLYEDICSCGSVKVPGAVTMHEVGHAMGFFHVADRNSLMFPFASGACPAGVLSPAESHHAAIAYSRPRGNTDPDRDPASGAAIALAESGSAPFKR